MLPTITQEMKYQKRLDKKFSNILKIPIALISLTGESNSKFNKNADPNEIILITGKGHEEEQIYKNKILKTSDKRIIRNLNLKIKSLTKKDQKFLQNNEILKSITNVNKPRNFHGLAID